MTSYYHLIAAGREISDTSDFYLVGVGTSRQANRDYLFLLAWATQRDYYFHIVDVDSTDFFMKCLRSVDPVANTNCFITTKAKKVTARDLVRAIKLSEAVPASLQHIRQANHLRDFLDVNYRAFRRTRSGRNSFPNEIR